MLRGSDRPTARSLAVCAARDDTSLRAPSCDALPLFTQSPVYKLPYLAILPVPMTILINILLGVYVFIALLMVLVILMQRPKSEGLGAAFGGGVTENIFGAQTTNVLTKITGWLAALFFLLTFALSILYAHKGNTQSGLSRELMKDLPPAGATASPTPNATPAATADGSPTPGPSPAASAGASSTPGPTQSSSSASQANSPEPSAMPSIPAKRPRR
jgi:preprotein translocase subunit SecG